MSKGQEEKGTRTGRGHLFLLLRALFLRAAGDPRLSLEKRYGSFAGYRKRWEAARDEMIKGRYMLAEDADQLTEKLERVRGMFPDEK